MRKIFPLFIPVLFIFVSCLPNQLDAQTSIPTTETAILPETSSATDTPLSPTPFLTPTLIFDGKLPDNMVFTNTEPENWVIYDPIQNQGLSLYTFNSLTIAPNGTIWLGGQSEIAMYDGNHWESFFIPDELLPSNGFALVNTLAVDRDNALWVGGGHTIYKFLDGIWTQERILETDINGMKINPVDGSLWVSLEWHEGIIKFDGKEWTSFFEDTARVRNINFDRNGVLWVATDDGLFSYDGKAWNQYPLELNCGESLCISASIAIDLDESVWFAMHANGLFHYVSAQWEMYKNDSFLTDYFGVSNMCFTPDGKLWLAKWSRQSMYLLYLKDGLWHIPRIKNKNGNSDFPIGTINDIACADDNSIWVASASQGVIHYTP